MADETESAGGEAGAETSGGAGAGSLLGDAGKTAGTVTTEAQTAGQTQGEGEAKAPAEGETPWYGKLEDPSLADYVAGKGWKSVEDALKSAQQVEKLAMSPEKLPLPKPDDKEGWNQVWDRLGRPETKDGYQLDKVPLPEGYTPHQPLVDGMATLAHEAGLSKGQMETLYSGYVAQESAVHKAAEEARDAAAGEQVAKLEKEMGPAWKEGVQDAQLAQKELGLSAEEVDGVGHVIGHDRALRLLMKVGRPLREDTAGDTHGSGQGFQRMEPAQAQARIDELTKDEGFRKRLRAGDQAAKREWDQLNEVAAAGRKG